MSKPRLTTDLSAVLASAPLNATAAGVVSEHVPEYHYTPAFPHHWETPPETKPFPADSQIALGHEIGRLKVVGYLGSNPSCGARYLVRCRCGRYEARHKKSLSNPLNATDKCHACRHLDDLRRHHKFLTTKKGEAWSLAHVKPLLGGPEK